MITEDQIKILEDYGLFQFIVDVYINNGSAELESIYPYLSFDEAPEVISARLFDTSDNDDFNPLCNALHRNDILYEVIYKDVGSPHYVLESIDNWWLKDDNHTSKANYVNYGGTMCNDGEFKTMENLVRPMLDIVGGNIGDIFLFKDIPFVVILDDRAFCITGVDLCVYNLPDNINAGYNDSYVKRFIDNWFRK